MVNIKAAFKSDRTMKALTGMTIYEFNSLLISFEKNFKAHKKIINKFRKRLRKEGGGSKHNLDTIEKKLFFILFYIKCYPTCDLSAFYFGVHRAQPPRWVRSLLSILEKTLDYEIVLPERQISSVEEFQKKFPEIKDIFIDGTERPIQRPKNGKKQKKNYSGKKKRHTKKNIIASDKDRKVLFLSKTKAGKTHDKKTLDKSSLIENIPDNVTCWFDTGFIGVNKNNIMMPKKKSKNRPLTEAERQENRIISGIRVLSENAINGPKRFGAISNIFRSRMAELDDKLMNVACGLWNYHLRMAVV
ncbi:MAG: transposase family protein [bacterium]